MVVVILSCKFPISVANVGWYPTADGILPNKAETSDPAWVNLNILSTKINTENEFHLSIENIDNFSEGNILILGGLFSYFQDLNINSRNLKIINDEITTLKNYFKNDVFFEFDENLDNKLLNEISKKSKINSFLSSFSFYKQDKDYDAIKILHCLKNLLLC